LKPEGQLMMAFCANEGAAKKIAAAKNIASCLIFSRKGMIAAPNDPAAAETGVPGKYDGLR
jgi:hypothetical protein